MKCDECLPVEAVEVAFATKRVGTRTSFISLATASSIRRGQALSMDFCTMPCKVTYSTPAT